MRPHRGGPRVLITAGPTQEPLDPVRFISNRSTGVMGYAVARAAAASGYRTTLIAGPTALEPPAVDRCIRVMTARQMLTALRREFPRCDWLFMTAAIADFRPQRVHRCKLKTATLPARVSVTFIRNPDLLATVTRTKRHQLIVAWSVETGPLEEAGRAKLLAKRADLLVANHISRRRAPFGAQPVRTLLLERTGRVTRLPSMPKEQLAAVLLDKVEALWYGGANVNMAAQCC